MCVFTNAVPILLAKSLSFGFSFKACSYASTAFSGYIKIFDYIVSSINWILQDNINVHKQTFYPQSLQANISSSKFTRKHFNPKPLLLSKLLYLLNFHISITKQVKRFWRILFFYSFSKLFFKNINKWIMKIVKNKLYKRNMIWNGIKSCTLLYKNKS